MLDQSDLDFVVTGAVEEDRLCHTVEAAVILKNLNNLSTTYLGFRGFGPNAEMCVLSRSVELDLDGRGASHRLEFQCD